jgi:MinD-like ATPase involved in chromosome partitioning or flagellar assembly
MIDEIVKLYKNIDLILPDTQKRAIQFVGSRSSEGTSVIVREFANVAINSFGKSVLIIDSDTKKLDQFAFFNVLPSTMLFDVVMDTKLPIDDAIYSTNINDIYLSAFTKMNANFNNLLTVNNIKYIIEILKSKFDLIVIDSVSDPSSVACVDSSVDGSILIVEAEATRWPVAEEMKDRITRNGGNILGIVFNKRHYYIPDLIYKYL